MDVSKRDAGLIRRVISIIVAVAITLLGVSILEWSFQTSGWEWIASRWLTGIAVGFYIGNLIDKRDIESCRWFSTMLFSVHAGLWVTVMYLLLRLIPAEKVRLSDFAVSVPVIARLPFYAESHAGAIVLVSAVLLFGAASLSFCRDSFSHWQPWMTQAIVIVPVFITDVLVFVGLVVGWVSAINSAQ